MGLKYYADINDAPVSDPLRQASIKTENQMIDLSGSGSQSGAEIEYNAACTAGMALEHFRILIN